MEAAETALIRVAMLRAMRIFDRTIPGHNMFQRVLQRIDDYLS